MAGLLGLSINGNNRLCRHVWHSLGAVGSVMKYDDFIKSKMTKSVDSGFEISVDDLNPMLFDWQKEIVRWSLAKGKSAIFADCGLGKTAMQLEWAHQVAIHTGKPVLILAPLAVSRQTHNEGIKFGNNCHICLDYTDVVTGVNITNYERLEKFQECSWGGICLDESSILKSFTGKIRNQIISMFDDVDYKLACTATPSPNDFVELGNHSEFLKIMNMSEMLATYFVHDGETSSEWRLKGHAETIYWEWISSWAIMMTNPSDIGFDSVKFNLPSLSINRHIIEIDSSEELDDSGQLSLFPVQASTLSERRFARKESTNKRVEKVIELVQSDPDASWLIWVDFNAESDAIYRALDGCVEVKGSDTIDHKENSIIGFSNGSIKRIVTKPSICGFGINWQICHNMIFCGLSDSYEMYYQSIRRCWRFGQLNNVTAHIVIGEREQSILNNITRKEISFTKMTTEMIKLTRDSIINQLKKTTRITERYMTNETIKLPERLGLPISDIDCVNYHIDHRYSTYHGDSCEIMQALPDNSIHYSIFSPPFADLYTYSNSDRDLGNCKTESEFYTHFEFIIQNLFRVIMDGRLVSFHCMNLPTSITRDGYIGIKDFRGDLIKMFQKAGFIYHSEVVIWKNPVTAMQRTKALGLLHKQIKKDSSKSRQGIPDYVVTMRKPGVNLTPIHHTPKQFPVGVWQNYASPVWMDINQSDTLQRTSARENRDEKHICPLQLGVIERCVNLWSLPGETVFTPFMGIGSEVYQSIKQGRYGIGIELKESYYNQAVKNCENAVESLKETSIFDIIGDSQ